MLAIALAGCGSDEPEEAEPASTTQAEQTEVRERFDELVGDVLESRGLDRATIDCALADLAASISDEEIKAATDEIIETGVPPPSVTEAAAAAGEACVAQ